ncbi:MAG: tripartite tricarboxylate transporter substrate binding protein [Burkholderiaceae bacterium]
MKRRTLLAGLALAPALRPALAQAPAAWPSKQIRIYVPFNAGSGSDTGARVYGEILGKMTGQPVVVENRPGASGQLAIQATKQAPADGHTILLASNSPLTVNPVVMKNLPYDPFKDIRPVIGLGRGPAAFVVKGDAPFKSMQDVVAFAKRERRPLNAGNYSAGYQLLNTWLGTAGGIEVTHIAYKGGIQMANDVVAGQLDIVATDLGGIMPLVQDKRVRVLAITGDKRHPISPESPTMIESGFPDFVSWVWTAFYVRAETPDDVTNRLADLMQEVLVADKAKAYHASINVEVMAFRPDEMRRFQLGEYERFKRVADAAGVKPQ